MPYSGFCRHPDDRLKIKESEARSKYLDLAKELRKLWNMWVIGIPIVIGTQRLVKSTERITNERMN